MKQDYLNKELLYFSNVRLDIISFMDNMRDKKVLEIGAGSGATLLELKRREIANEIHGFDIIDIRPSKDGFNSFTIGNIENDTLQHEDNRIDIIILGDVLEHLIEPDKVIAKLKLKLNDQGHMYVSLPNIRFYQALIKIFIKGSFQYEDMGIFDRTHLRFFCKKDMIKLFESQNFKVLKIDSVLKHSKSKKALLNKLTLNLFEEFLSPQYLLKISK